MLKAPFELYDYVHIADVNGHVCTADDPELAAQVLAALRFFVPEREQQPQKQPSQPEMLPSGSADC